jgi:putative thioredoxin
MAVDVTESTFESEVLERSRQLPVVVDFWADWCAPCKALSPALEAAAAKRQGKVVLAKLDVDSNQQLAALYRVQGIPAVKAFRDGAVVDEFVGAQPPPRVEAFFDSLLPSKADELFAAGDELSLREAAELEPGRDDVAVALAKARLDRGADDEALEAVEGHEGDFAAAGIAARVRLLQAGIGAEAFAALDRGDREAALDSLIEQLTRINAAGDGTPSVARGIPLNSAAAPEALLDPAEARDLLRRAIVGILSETNPGDPTARAYRRKLSTALG